MEEQETVGAPTASSDVVLLLPSASNPPTEVRSRHTPVQASTQSSLHKYHTSEQEGRSRRTARGDSSLHRDVWQVKLIRNVLRLALLM